MKYGVTLLVLSIFVGVLVLSAQTTSTPRIDKREARQKKRIEQGEKSGQLTPHEAKRLKKREAKIQKDEAAAKSDGKVTVKERRKLNRELNSTSRTIDRKKQNPRRN